MKKQSDIFIYTSKINFNLSDIDFKNALGLLKKEEQDRIILKKDYKLRYQTLISTLLTKKAIKHALGLTENCFEIKRDMMNRPYIKTKEKINIDFNISHSNDWIVCAISSIGKIGIDIEEILPIDINIAKEFLSIDEWEHLCNYHEKKVELFYKYWTLKEAFFKAIGIGINDFIKEINFVELDYKNNIFKKELNKDIWNFYHSIFNNNYALSLAVNRPIKNITFYNLTCGSALLRKLNIN